MARSVVRLAFLIVLVGCGTLAGPRRGNSDLLTLDEIRASSATTAYELIQQLRPQFLRSRGSVSMRDPRPVYPIVYVNEMRHGAIDTLRSILIDEISEIRYISGPDATTRWGTGHGGGVIQIVAMF